jgi:hypothetical protein
MKRKIEIYERACFTYGVMTLCYLIDQYEQEDNFEECDLILKAINNIQALGVKLPTKYTEASVNWLNRNMQKTCKDFFGLEIPLEKIKANERIPIYAELVKQEILKIK